MVRLNDHQLAQMLDEGEIVIIDESAGAEVVIAPDNLAPLISILEYFRDLVMIAQGVAMTETSQDPHACGWTVQHSDTTSSYRPALGAHGHTLLQAIYFETEDEAWWFIDNVILPRAAAKVTQGWVEA